MTQDCLTKYQQYFAGKLADKVVAWKDAIQIGDDKCADLRLYEIKMMNVLMESLCENKICYTHYFLPVVTLYDQGSLNVGVTFSITESITITDIDSILWTIGANTATTVGATIAAPNNANTEISLVITLDNEETITWKGMVSTLSGGIINLVGTNLVVDDAAICPKLDLSETFNQFSGSTTYLGDHSWDYGDDEDAVTIANPAPHNYEGFTAGEFLKISKTANVGDSFLGNPIGTTQSEMIIFMLDPCGVNHCCLVNQLKHLVNS